MYLVLSGTLQPACLSFLLSLLQPGLGGITWSLQAMSNVSSSFWSSLYLEGGDYGDVHHRAPPDPRPLLAVKFNQVPLIRSERIRWISFRVGRNNRIPLRLLISCVCGVITFIQVGNLFWRRRIKTDLLLHVSSVRGNFLKFFIRIMFIHHGTYSL